MEFMKEEFAERERRLDQEAFEKKLEREVPDSEHDGNRRQLKKENLLKFILAGNATFTILNTETGGRFTYRIKQKENEDGNKTPHFVSLLSGPDNESAFTYFGFIRENATFIYGGRKSRISREAPSVKAFEWFWRNLKNLRTVEVWHEGRCGACGRKLTVPESIESGLGPICAGKEGN